MPAENRSLLIVALPLAVVAVASILLWDTQRRTEIRDRYHPSLGLNVAVIRPASAEMKFSENWRPSRRVLEDPNAQLEHAKELMREARSDPSLYPMAEEEFDLAFNGLPAGPQAEEAFYLRCRCIGLWGEKRFADSIGGFQSFLERFPGSTLCGSVYYDLALTYHVGLNDLDNAKDYYRKAQAIGPQTFIGLLASEKLAGMP